VRNQKTNSAHRPCVRQPTLHKDALCDAGERQACHCGPALRACHGGPVRALRQSGRTHNCRLPWRNAGLFQRACSLTALIARDRITTRFPAARCRHAALSKDRTAFDVERCFARCIGSFIGIAC
jgi:hypothetical protein